jgi:hypothetical protein
MRRRHGHALRAAVFVTLPILIVLGGRARAAGDEIALRRDGAVYRIPVTLDGHLVRPFMIDTGASEVQVSTDVLRAMFPRGSAAPVYLPGGTYRLADGREVSNRRFLIPSLRIGDREFHQVVASVGGPDAPLLLGQNVLGRLGVWSIDNRRSVLVLGPRPAAPPAGDCADWRTAQGECEVAVVRDFLRDVRPPHDVTKLTLLRSDGDHASVLVDAVRDGRTKMARLCGPMDLRRADGGWRVVGASGLLEVDRGARCLP